MLTVLWGNGELKETLVTLHSFFFSFFLMLSPETKEKIGIWETCLSS